MSEKPVIGILAHYINGEQSAFRYDRIFTNGAYTSMVEKSGALCAIIPYWHKSWLDICSGFLFQGGFDVEPSLYGQERSTLCGPSREDMDRRDIEAIRDIHEAKKAILGICRGIQIINVALGGSLYQDQSLCTAVKHDRIDKPYEAVHKVRLSSCLQSLYNQKEIGVNSLHHQTVKTISPDLSVCATSEDNVVEALEGSNILAVQWHPEAMEDSLIFDRFIRMAKGE